MPKSLPELLPDAAGFPKTAILTPKVHRVLGLNPSASTGPGTNTYLIGVDGGEPLLLDTGTGLAAYFDLLRSHVAEGGGRAPRRCLFTHVHGDHIGGAAGVAALFPGITFHKFPWPGKDEAYPVRLARVQDGDVFRGPGYTLRAIHTPGHAQDHLCWYLEEERALFTGDVVLGKGTTVIPLDGGDLADYMATLHRLQGLSAARIYPGHGPVIDDPREKLAFYIEHRLERERQVLA
ncbi:MAG: beta-lactamase-like protein 2, partial [Candidatus Lambdaproteobacteria bacterium]|nr:beta-lactamase-like protein 2 [Candidatus Lambdaproteobacteria bacterium]